MARILSQSAWTSLWSFVNAANGSFEVRYLLASTFPVPKWPIVEVDHIREEDEEDAKDCCGKESFDTLDNGDAHSEELRRPVQAAVRLLLNIYALSSRPSDLKIWQSLCFSNPFFARHSDTEDLV